MNNVVEMLQHNHIKELYGFTACLLYHLYNDFSLAICSCQSSLQQISIGPTDLYLQCRSGGGYGNNIGGDGFGSGGNYGNGGFANGSYGGNVSSASGGFDGNSGIVDGFGGSSGLGYGGDKQFGAKEAGDTNSGEPLDGNYNDDFDDTGDFAKRA
ncbi:heterogeneous nuclear ribonucleoprotein A3-like [Tripterygium wilfordii]|uniref:heterogeneous nuclear ribonucleoprotein A3-like n=1 Tax=Tripterygium wilfordii TaxID=458696 RepID=UPI0018F84427|nr:heterogeneous nuclear ribonucleoprotein A3-like [Tripterygium wilfordii]